MTIVYATPDELEALTMADRVAVMRNGSIEQIATPHEIFTQPANLFVAGFILVPQCVPGRTLKSLIKSGVIVLIVFAVVVLALASAKLYGVYFVK